VAFWRQAWPSGTNLPVSVAAVCCHFPRTLSNLRKPGQKLHHTNDGPVCFFSADRGVGRLPSGPPRPHVKTLENNFDRPPPLTPARNGPEAGPPGLQPTHALAPIVPPSLRSSEFPGFYLCLVLRMKCCTISQVWDSERVVIIPEHYIFTADARANRNVDILR
jgi:hypothetical protein